MFRLQYGFDLSNEYFAWNVQKMINEGRQWKWLVKLREHRLDVYYVAVTSNLAEKYYNKWRKI